MIGMHQKVCFTPQCSAILQNFIAHGWGMRFYVLWIIVLKYDIEPKVMNTQMVCENITPWWFEMSNYNFMSKHPSLLGDIIYLSAFSLRPLPCHYFLCIIITSVSEVILFSPCVFVCLWLCLCLYHDVCPDDLTMKDWCHTNNILEVLCWGCLVVQVMFHALMTSSMTSPGHKVGQILKVIYLRQYLS